MKRLALVMLAMTACASLAWGQHGKIGDVDNAGTVTKMGKSTGVGGVIEPVPGVSDLDKNWINFAPNVIQNSWPNCPFSGFDDYSGAIPTHGWKELALRFYARPDADSVERAIVAISWQQSSVAAVDTANAALAVELYNDPTAANAWVVDTLAYKKLSAVHDSTNWQAAHPGEQLFVVTARDSSVGYWNLIPLADRRGVPFTADYTRIRVRVLLVYNPAKAPYPFRKITAGSTVPQCFRADLVGRR